MLIGLHADSASAAGNGSITITPQSSTVNVGGTVAVDVVVEPPDGGLSIWIITVAFDSDIVHAVSCTPATFPPGGVGASLCESRNTQGDPVHDEEVVLGAYLRNDNGTPVGLTETQSLANIVFQAVGPSGHVTDLLISTTAFLTPEGDEYIPDRNDGEIIITGTLPTPNVGPVGGVVDVISDGSSGGSTTGLPFVAAVGAILAATAFVLSRRMIRR